MTKTLATAVSGVTLRRTTCAHITRKDGEEEFYTEHDQNLVMDVPPSSGDVTFAARAGFSRSANQGNLSFEIDRIEMRGPLLLDGIDRALLRAGVYDNAAIVIFETDWSTPVYADAVLRAGWFGEVELRDDEFHVEVVGLTQALSKKIVELYTADCMADLGDERCQVDLGPFTISGSVSTVTNQRVFEASSVPAAPGGLLTWTSGNNTGLSMDIHSIDGNEIVLFLPMPFPIEEGDGFDAYRGCDKLFTTCRDVFDNVVNFRGHGLLVPGRDWMMSSPLGQDSEAPEAE